MNISENTKAMLFEQLPPEIFLRIVASLQFEEITKAFSGLNSRLNSLIQCITDGNFQVSYNDDESARLIDSYPNQIGRLILTHSPSVDFTSAGNLRSLTIRYGTLAQLNVIRPQHFPMLEILHVCGVNGPSVVEKAQIINDLFEVILSNGFPRLRICTAAGIEPLVLNEKWTGSSAIRLLLLEGQTPVVVEKLKVLCSNLRQPRSLVRTSIDSQIDVVQSNIIGQKRMIHELRLLKQLESEKTFILDYCEQRSQFVLGGRIFPRSDPYCWASFRVEIRLPVEFPFKSPDARFLDPIYHSLIEDNGGNCCCWSFDPYPWQSTRRLIDYITTMIDLIDSPARWDGHGDSTRFYEFTNNYSVFYEKAMQSVLRYGLVRF